VLLIVVALAFKAALCHSEAARASILIEGCFSSIAEEIIRDWSQAAQTLADVHVPTEEELGVIESLPMRISREILSTLKYKSKTNMDISQRVASLAGTWNLPICWVTHVLHLQLSRATFRLQSPPPKHCAAHGVQTMTSHL
jgi:hypothetical protein